MSVERRSLIQILGAGLTTSQVEAGQHRHELSLPAKNAAAYVPRALTPAEYRVVDRLADLIFPADETSAGAHDAAVARYIDIVLLYGRKETLTSWKNGVDAVDAAARKAHGRPFNEITREQQTELMRTMAANEKDPATQLEKFFAMMKQLAIEAFYLSAAGRQSLGYKGDTAIERFPGCTHDKHKG